QKSKPFLKDKLKQFLLKDRVSSIDLKYYLPRFFSEFEKYATQLELLYNSLNDEESRELLIDLISFRLLGNTKVKLRTNNAENSKTLKKIKEIENHDDIIDPKFLHFTLTKFDLNSFGKDIK